MSIHWTDEYDRKLLAFKHGYSGDGSRARQTGDRLSIAGGRSFAEVARQLNAFFGTEIFTKDAVRKRYPLISPPPSFADYPPPAPTPYFSAHFDEDGKLRQRAPEKLDWRGAVAELEDSGRWYKTLVLSDTQGVMWDEVLTQQAISEHPDADIILIPGDVADWESAAKYTHERDYPMLLESDWLVRFYQTLTDRYPHAPILVTNSNHRRRVEKLMRTLPQGLLFLAEHNPERYLAQPFANVVAIEPWWVQLGDTVYAHKEGRTAIPGNNALDAIATFRNWRDSGQHGVDPFRLIVTGHSHKLAELVLHGIKGIEPGCLARLPMNYMRTAEIQQTQENGYSVVLQRGGRAELNECRALHL
jgi:hypothetical protein